MKKKKCTKCKKWKILDDFYKRGLNKVTYNSWCKSCFKEYHKNNLDKINRSRRRHYIKNFEKIKETNKKWRLKNQEKVRASRRKYLKKYLSNNKNKIDSSLSTAINCAINYHLKRKRKGNRWEDLVGYKLEDLMKHLEKQFKPGMSWENYGRNGWHIDHIIPKNSFKYNKSEDKEFKQCWALDNIRPLWAKENIIKSNGFK